MPRERELGLLADTCAGQPRLRVCESRHGCRCWRFVPLKSLHPLLSPAGLGPSLGRKLFIEAQASINVPSTEKCSEDSSRPFFACSTIAARNAPPLRGESTAHGCAKGARIERGLVDSMSRNQRKSRLYSKLLTKLPIATHRKQRDQKLGLQQPLRWYRRPARLLRTSPRRPPLISPSARSAKPLILTKRVRLRNPLFDRAHHQQRSLFPRFSSHAQKMMDSMAENKRFSAAC